MLTVENLTAGYAGSQALFDVSLQLGAGQVLALLGRNGMGKTTTVGSITGLMPAWGGATWGGSVTFERRSIIGLKPYQIGRLGVGLVPEGRHIFPTLTVQENLIATARHDPDRWTLERIWDLFPRLRERRSNPGRLLSGGEQQMLAIGRALMTNPKLLILDEATEGLAPVIRSEIWAVLAALKAQGLSILLIDKNLSAVLRLADTIVVMEKGRSVWTGTPAALAQAEAVRAAYLHV